MSSNRAAELTRRSMLASSCAMAATTALPADAAVDGPPHTKMSKVRQEFERLLPLWQVEREQFSNSSCSSDYWQGPHGKAIIALGPAIIPNLLQQIKAGDHFFNVPMEIITDVDITNGEYESEQASSKLWVQWWEAATKEPT